MTSPLLRRTRPASSARQFLYLRQTADLRRQRLLSDTISRKLNQRVERARAGRAVFLVSAGHTLILRGSARSIQVIVWESGREMGDWLSGHVETSPLRTPGLRKEAHTL